MIATQDFRENPKDLRRDVHDDDETAVEFFKGFQEIQRTDWHSLKTFSNVSRDWTGTMLEPLDISWKVFIFFKKFCAFGATMKYIRPLDAYS